MKIRFPFLIIEGKSYATDKNIYEAQNQTAVSGACSLQILHDLDDIARKTEIITRNSPHHQRQEEEEEEEEREQPLVFTICTQGPIHELWVHYTAMRCGNRKYNMSILKSCNMAVADEVPGFLTAVDNVMSWGAAEHLIEVASKLQAIHLASRTHD